MNKLEAEVIRAVELLRNKPGRGVIILVMEPDGMHVWARSVSPRTVCTLADVQNLIWELWESVPAEFKKVSEDKA